MTRYRFCLGFSLTMSVMLVAVTSLSANSALQSEPVHVNVLSPQQALEQDARWYSEHFGVSFEESLRRMQLQQAAAQLSTVLSSENEDTYAGMWIDHEPEHAINAAFTSNGAETLAHYTQHTSLAGIVNLYPARYTLSQLRAIQNRLFYSITVEHGLDAISEIDIQANRIVIYTPSPGLVSKVLDSERLSSGTVTLIETNADNLTIKEELNDYAGIGQNYGTSAFIAIDTVRGTKYHTTAGHLPSRIYFIMALQIRLMYHSSSNSI